MYVHTCDMCMCVYMCERLIYRITTFKNLLGVKYNLSRKRYHKNIKIVPLDKTSKETNLSYYNNIQKPLGSKL